MKHRGKSSKLKYEHALIEGLRPLLENIAPWEEIHSIIPGRIRPTKGSKRQIRLEIKYFTCRAPGGPFISGAESKRLGWCSLERSYREDDLESQTQ